LNAFIVSGFAATALQAPPSVAIHMIAIGGISLMILAMISRVSLGHSGRAMELPGSFALAYWLLGAATFCRILANLIPEFYTPLLWLAGLGWASGFGLFIYYYLPILLSARPDGRPG
jgi:uncharacterized protein involved in response to NO